ncbi:hypothetical protein O7635_32940 [Asanoa sp. WMMD1127]|uniref:hypothetical protein n=1 Tax=Asanoa sp. WMMD1127 TaxID=3016107 RepID=UPI002416DB24|nr:hypothetical protein [Asanoa sp. WMMD1127]MDG4826681.1 hypothetical protein [Asanoa sp. WMMD1127]
MSRRWRWRAELAADAGGGDLPASGSNLVCRFSAESMVKEGDTARVWVNLEKIHLFDPSDGRNLTLHEGTSARFACLGHVGKGSLTSRGVRE